MSLNFRVAARGLARTPGFLVSTVVTLALGMGVATAIFSLVSAILLREVPAHEPDRLVNVHRTAKDGSSFHAFSSLDLRDLRESAGRSFASLAAFSSTVVSLRQVESFQPAELLSVQVTSANYFEALGVAPLLGRTFLPADDTPGTSTVLLSERLWRRRFGASREVLGSAVTLNGLPYTVVGIVPARFTGTFVGFAFDLWIPLSAPAAGAPPDALTNPAADWLEIFGRLAPGVSKEAEQASLSIAASTISREHPKGGEPWGVDVRAMAPVDDSLRAVVTRLFVLLLIVSGLVLGIACINVAGLLLARGAARRREMAIRQAIGAGTGALARQLLAETVLLFGSGSLLGGFLAWWLSGALLAFSPKYAMPLELDVAPGPFVLLVAMLATAVTGLLFGLLPALRAARVDLVPALKEGRNEPRPALVGARSLFVVAQMAATMLLLVAAGLLVKSIDRIRKADAGFDATGVRMASIDFGLVGRGRATAEALQRDLLARAAALPGVTSAALVRSVPLGGFGPRTGRVEVEGLTAPTREGFEVFLGTASPGSFATLRIPLLSGRDFRLTDDASAPRVAIVNETFASRFWPGESALGRRFLVEGQAVEVIGVARAGKYKSLMEEPRPYATVPLAQNPSRRMTLLLRTETGANPAAPLRDLVRGLDPDLPFQDPMLLSDFIAVSFLPQRMAGTVTSALGLLGLVLSSVGLYGLVAFTVGQRTREIGIRVAIGARPAQVLALVLRQSALLGGAGILAGGAAALVAGRLVSSLLFGVRATDPIALTGAALVLAAVVLLASVVPAWRALRIDPLRALRCD